MATTLMILDQKTSKKATFPEKYGTWFKLKLQKKGIFSLFFVLVTNCPVPNCPLWLSWCQIVRFYYPGAKLSALLSWCQIDRCQIVRCQIVLQSWVLHKYLPSVKVAILNFFAWQNPFNHHAKFHLVLRPPSSLLWFFLKLLTHFVF